MARQPIKIGDKVFLNADARLWMRDIGVRPGTVMAMAGEVPGIDFWDIDARIWVNPRNLEDIE